MTPADQSGAERLAKKTVENYLNSCRMTDRNQIGNYLFKLCSVAGVLMAQADGAKDAADQLIAVGLFIYDRMQKEPGSFGSRLMLERKREIPHLSSERERLEGEIQPSLLPH